MKKEWERACKRLHNLGKNANRPTYIRHSQWAFIEGARKSDEYVAYMEDIGHSAAFPTPMEAVLNLESKTIGKIIDET